VPADRRTLGIALDERLHEFVCLDTRKRRTSLAQRRQPRRQWLRLLHVRALLVVVVEPKVARLAACRHSVYHDVAELELLELNEQRAFLVSAEERGVQHEAPRREIFDSPLSTTLPSSELGGSAERWVGLRTPQWSRMVAIECAGSSNRHL
jgi:hypothetical protein